MKIPFKVGMESTLHRCIHKAAQMVSAPWDVTSLSTGGTHTHALNLKLELAIIFLYFPRGSGRGVSKAMMSVVRLGGYVQRHSVAPAARGTFQLIIHLL